MDDDISTTDAIDRLKAAWTARDADKVQGLLELLTSRLAYMHAANGRNPPPTSTPASTPGH